MDPTTIDDDQFNRAYQQNNQHPFAHIHNQDGRVFLPNISINIESIVVDTVFPDCHGYHVTIEHGPFKWTTSKSDQNFTDLQTSLKEFAQTETKRSISETHERRDEWSCLAVLNNQTGSGNSNIDEERCQILRNYLTEILQHSQLRNHPATCEFLEVGYVSFVCGLAPSSKEGYLIKQSDDVHHVYNFFSRLPSILEALIFHQKQKWFVIKDTFVGYISPDSSEVGFPMLVDQDFEVLGDSHSSQKRHVIQIRNLQRTLKLKCSSFHNYNKWIQSLNGLTERAHDFISIDTHRFHSFAPIRQKQLGHWFINGKSYMKSLAKAIASAKEEIFISNWWLSPEIMLMRPFADDSMRLDHLLGQVADAGVRVYVMVFKEVTFVDNLNSAHTKEALMKISQKGNIKVMRHPDHLRISTDLLWSHHEKMLIIDQKIAFVGGIDLCFGRWDDEYHCLTDLGQVNDPSSNRVFEMTQERDGKVSIVQVAENNPHSGDPIQVTTFYPFESNEGKNELTEKIPQADERKSEVPEEIRRAVRRQMKDTENQYFIGKDYSNLYTRKDDAVEKYDQDYLDRTTEPRAPWHDEGFVVLGAVARDVARHFIQRWNIHKYEKYLNDKSYPFLWPKTYDDKDELTVGNWKEFLSCEPYQIDAQCVRSIGPWSGGTRTTEISIQNAYIEMIGAAKYFIYIENQFFITLADNARIRNQVAEALYQRVLRAHTSDEKFRVYILIPLLTGFDDSNAIRASLHGTMQSIIRNEKSLFKRLEAAGVPPSGYITFFGVRQHDRLMGKSVTEIIYVHSKLMIVDDRMAICGSANINDRSLLGDRDSEFCVVINDIEEEECRFDGQLVRVGKFCSSWRRRLFSMLLGTLWENKYDIDVTDPISDEFYGYFRQVARMNTLIYEDVFATIPTDSVRRINQIKQFRGRPKLVDLDPQRAKEKLSWIRGLVVEYPLYFLDEEHYQPSFLTLEGLVPTAMWT